MFLVSVLFIVGLVCLIKGGDWFVDGAVGIAHHFNMPELLIGATVVSIGTTLPEAMVSVTSAIGGHGEIAYGNAIGSVICNTAFIAALVIAIRPSEIDKKSLKMPVIFFFAAAAIYSCVAYFSGSFGRITGAVLLAIFVIYMVITVRVALKDAKTSASLTEEDKPAEGKSFYKEVIMLVVGAAIIAVGAQLLVDNGTIIARALNVPESVIALTLVALGTSLPELVTAVTSLIKGHGALSVGNIVGANLFNLVWVSGLSVLCSPFTIPMASNIGGHNASLVLDIPLMLFVMAFMTLPALKRGKLSRLQGIVLLAVYAAFCVIQFTM